MTLYQRGIVNKCCYYSFCFKHLKTWGLLIPAQGFEKAWPCKLCFLGSRGRPKSTAAWKNVGRFGGWAAICDPPRLQTMISSRSHMAERVLPGVTVLLLFCCCYLFTEAVDEMWEVPGAGGADWRRGFWGRLAWKGTQRRAGQCRSSQPNRGRAGRGHLWDGHGRRPPTCLFLSSDGAKMWWHRCCFSSPHHDWIHK